MAIIPQLCFGTMIYTLCYTINSNVVITQCVQFLMLSTFQFCVHIICGDFNGENKLIKHTLNVYKTSSISLKAAHTENNNFSPDKSNVFQLNAVDNKLIVSSSDSVQRLSLLFTWHLFCFSFIGLSCFPRNPFLSIQMKIDMMMVGIRVVM